MAAYGALYVVLRRLLDAGVGAVVESNFYRGWAEEHLAPFVARSHAALIHCHAPLDAIVERYVARAQRGERHPGHHDVAVVPRLRQTLRDGSFEPLALGIPTLLVDTTDGYAPDLPQVLAFLRQQISGPITAW
jgi:predicted kinase